MLRPLISLFLFSALPTGGFASQILKTSGFSTCLADASISVQNVDIQYNNDDKTVTFNVAGTSTKSINVTAVLNVTAYGVNVYQNSFNPCDGSTYVAQLCPVPSGTFSAEGTQTIPDSYASQIPAIAFSVPDIAAQATLQLKALDTGEDVACISSNVNNGKTVSVPAVTYVVAGIAGAALIMTGLSALGAAGAQGGSGTISPSFSEVFGTLQGFAMNGMASVNYPPVYRSFAKNFAFSTGIVPWSNLQRSIDSFRNVTGGNLTADSVQFLENATLVFDSSNSKRSFGYFMERDISTSIGSSSNSTSNSTSSIQATVSGIQAYAEQLSVPQANTFMTVLLIVAIVVAAIVVGILLLKVILEGWALFGNFPKKLTSFRKRYWGIMARTIVQLILVFYGVWVLYSVFQFTHGDSWAAKALAGVTLGLFTAVLAFFTWKIWVTANRFKKLEGDASGLYENKETWIKYSLFYDSYKKQFYLMFVPAILYMLAKGIILAAADGHGLTQSVGQIIVEALMLGLLIWNRPYERRSGNVINIFIQVVRVLSVVCILVFVEELGIAQTTQTITGVVLIAVQSLLTGVLAILIVANAIIMCCKENPHRKRRKEAEKLNRDLDNLTPLDARNSLLLDAAKMPTNYSNDPKYPLAKENSSDSFMREPSNPYADATLLRPYASQGRIFAPQNARMAGALESRENLVAGAAPLGGGGGGSPPRQPTVPNLQSFNSYGRGY